MISLSSPHHTIITPSSSHIVIRQTSMTHTLADKDHYISASQSKSVYGPVETYLNWPLYYFATDIYPISV